MNKISILLTLIVVFAFAVEVNAANSWNSCGDVLIDSRDNQSYPTVLIGSQCWMQKNLNIGKMISGSKNQGKSCADESSIKKYCYSDETNNCMTDGGLYQWDQAMCGETVEGSRGICPIGWHIPTHYEFIEMERALCTSGSCNTDFPYDTETWGWRGTNEGTSMKNLAGSFRAVLAGYRNFPSGDFYKKGKGAFFRTSTNDGYSWYENNLSWYHSLFYRNTGVGRYFGSEKYGFSVRCIKNTNDTTTEDPEEDEPGVLNAPTVNLSTRQSRPIVIPTQSTVTDIKSSNIVTNPKTTQTVTLDVTKAGAAAAYGTVTNQGIDSVGITSHAVGSRVKLTVTITDTTKVKFAGWNDGNVCSGRSLICEFTITGNETAKANFDFINPSGALLPTSSNLSSDSSNYSPLDLEKGMARDGVVILQKYLNSHGYVVNTNQGEEGSIGHETNYFGEKTKQALIKFQKDKGITPASGFFGPQTRRAMGM